MSKANEARVPVFTSPMSRDEWLSYFAIYGSDIPDLEIALRRVSETPETPKEVPAVAPERGRSSCR